MSERVVIPLARNNAGTADVEPTSQRSRLRVVVADPDVLARSMIAATLAGNGCELIAQVASGSEVLNVLATESVSVVVADACALPDGLALIAEAGQQVAIVVLTGCDDEKQLRNVLVAGAAGCLRKHDGLGALPHAVQAAANGCAMINRVALQAALRAGIQASQTISPSVLRQLTSREVDVLQFICGGLTNEEIAGRLRMSHGTARTHVSHLMTKLSCSHRTQLALLAVGVIGSALPGVLTGA